MNGHSLGQPYTLKALRSPAPKKHGELLCSIFQTYLVTEPHYLSNIL